MLGKFQQLPLGIESKVINSNSNSDSNSTSTINSNSNSKNGWAVYKYLLFRSITFLN